MARPPDRSLARRAGLNRFAAVVAGSLALAGPPGGSVARTARPPALRPVSAEVYAGRWYEFARTPNTVQKDCQGPTYDFEGWAEGNFSVVLTCHRGGPAGPAKLERAKARILSPADNARFRMSFFGGLVHQEYWIVDHADDNSWVMMATPGGHYLWLLARRPVLSPAILAVALARAEALGYAPSKLIYPAPAAG